jgi:energy-coupling factor transporter ATP-binding protein EcfA2
MSQLIQTLALAPFHDRFISELGRTEKQRVKIACQILLDTDIIVLDNVIKHMDLYDAAFIIDYLRDWAQKLNRIVIMACNPATYELLAMFYKSECSEFMRL